MKTIILNIILIFFTFNCDFKLFAEDSKLTKSTTQINLLFCSKIGPKKLNTEVLVYDVRTRNQRKELLIQLNKEGIIIFSDTLLIEMDEEPIIELREINGDKIDDLAIEYFRPGRGGNIVSIIYIFNKTKISLNRISNSILYPNLTYNEDLNFISSFRFYGGDAVQIEFLKIKDDTLFPKYRVIKEVEKIYIKKLIKEEWIKIGEKSIDSDIIIPEIIELEPEIKIKNAS